MPKRVSVCILFLTLVPVSAFAQRITAPVEIATAHVGDVGAVLEGWAKRYFGIRTETESQALYSEITRKLQSFHPKTLNKEDYDFGLFEDPHSLVFPAAVPSNGATTLVRILLWRGHPLYVTNLRGAASR